jgi:predicted amidohydrolase
MKIATIQCCPAYGKKTENLRHVAQLVLDAAKERPDLVILPELVTSGYSMMSRADADAFAEVIEPGNTTYDIMAALSAKTNAAIVWGMVERDKGTGDLYNSQVFLAGQTCVSYRKVNLWGNDWLWAKPGRANPPVVDFQGKKVGLLICRDVRDKKDSNWKSFYEKGDSDVVVLSSNWGRGAFPSGSWMDFAKDNNTTLVVSNRYGEEPHGANDFGQGGICVVYPDQRVHCEGLVWGQDCIVYAEV